MNWPRQYYRSGGADAFLFYVVYGPVPQEFTISSPKYRVDNIPEDRHQGDIDDPDFNNVHVEIKFSKE